MDEIGFFIYRWNIINVREGGKKMNQFRSQNSRSTIAMFLSLPILSWAFYDFANTIFSSNINTIFFPFYMDETLGTDEVKQQSSLCLNCYHHKPRYALIFDPFLRNVQRCI